MTQATKHTPTPWKVMRRDSGWDIKAGSREVAVVFSRGDDVQQANAAHIVRCVNSHEALVQALVELDSNLENHQESEYARYQRRTIRAALAKVQQ
jgi:hypothetical protein